MVCQRCQTVNPELARFCIRCGQPLPRLCPVCGTENPPGARFCNQCGSPLVPGAATLPAPAAPPVPTVPSDEDAEQRRVVTVLFADLTSSTAIAEALDPEELRALLGAFFETMTRAIHRHGGTVEKYIGDAVMAIFGLPITHEDDPLRAVRAALEMQHDLHEFNARRQSRDASAPQLRIRIGINTGEVAAAGGHAEGRDFLITGDAVTVAARLQQSAAVGSIVVGPRTYRSTSGAVRYRMLGEEVALRGRGRPVRLWEVLGLEEDGAAPVQRPRGVEGLSAPMIGRDLEVELLRAIYLRVRRERRPHLVTIVGVPGVGKTRLAREFQEQTQQGSVFAAESAGEPDAVPGPARPPLLLEGRCPPYGEGVTYWPLAEVLRGRCGISALEAPETARAKLLTCVRLTLAEANRTEDAEVLAALLGHTIGIETAERRQALLPTDQALLQEALLRAWRVFFEALAAPSGLIVLIEDAHWADDALLDLLESVAARAANVPLLLLCTARPELLERRSEWGGGKRNATTLALESLTRSDTQRLVRELLPGANVPESLREGILAKGDGNPFFIEEILRMLVDRGILEPDPDGGWRVAPSWEGSEEVSDPAIPDTAQGVLAARLDLLRPEERDVLQHAAVIGRYFWPSALLALAGHLEAEQLDAVLESLAARDLVQVSEHAKASIAPQDEQVYTFNHALTREVVYSTMVRTRRAHEHERVAEWLESLAQGREEEFADLLAQHYRQYYLQVNLARSRNTARRLTVRAKALRYLTLSGDAALARHAGQRAERTYSAALALLEDEPDPSEAWQRVDLLTRRGDARWAVRRADDAWHDYRTALAQWTALSAPTAEVAPAEGAADPAVRWCQQGMRLYRLLVQLPTRFGSLFAQRPAYDELRQYLDRGLALAQEGDQCDTAEYAALLTAKSFFWWAWAEQRGERELLDALRSAREAVRITESVGDPRGASEALDALGNIQATTTDLRGYLESQARRLDWARQIDEPYELVDIRAEVSQAQVLLGDYPEALRNVRVGWEIAQTVEEAPPRMQALCVMVVGYFEWDRWPEALHSGEDLARVVATAETRPLHHLHWARLDLATIHARTGNREQAEALRREQADLMPRSDTLYIELARARLALALGATREARHLLEGGMECRSGRHSLPALLAELAELAARNGDQALFDAIGGQALELGWRSGARKALAQAIRARAIVALAAQRWDDALADAQSALSRYQDLGTPWEEARSRYVLAGLYRRRNAPGDDALAHAELERAHTLFATVGAVRDLARARTALAGGDVRLP